MARIFSTNPIHPQAEARLRAAHDFHIATATDAATLIAEGCDADVVIVRAPMPAEYFAQATNLRAAVRHGAGLDMIPYEAATNAGVLIANVPGVNAPTVAEHVFMVTLALLRRFRLQDRDLRAQGWAAGRAHADFGHDLGGRTIGIVGMGNIGNAVAKIARFGFGLEVIASSRSRLGMVDGIEFVALDHLFEQADVVVLCCPLTPETTGLVNRDRLARMKPDALLVNVARGPVIDDAALIEALRENRIGGAALDVFAHQPLAPDHPYLTFDNVIVTPHAAGISEESMLRMGMGAAEETLRVLDGQLPLNFRNPEVTEHYRRRFPR